MKVLAAETAAASRVGCTSWAAIEPEWSVTSIMLASPVGTWWVTRGRASATPSSATAARASAVGTWRSQDGVAATTCAHGRHRGEADRVARLRRRAHR